MAEFWALSRLLREKCDENTAMQTYCTLIASKYLESEKKELRAQSVDEENIILKIDIGNLKSLHRTAVENAEAQAELDSHLLEFYEEHLKSAFDIDECEIEKLASYEEIKHELETRDSINMQQQLYRRKLKTAKKMEGRNIVKKYRQKVEEHYNTQIERLNLENSVKKLKACEARQQEQQDLILELVKGSFDLQNINAELYPQPCQTQNTLSGSPRLSENKAPDLNNNKGLSSRLLMDFRQFKVPSPMTNVPKTRQLNQRNGLNRLLQQAEVIRKSMQQTSPMGLSGSLPTPRLLGILKAPNESQKLTETSSQKSVSFEVDLRSTIDETQGAATANDTPTISEIVIDSEMDESLTEVEPNKPKIEIIEEVILKPADKIFKAPESRQFKAQDQKANTKRKANDEDIIFSIDSPTPSKKKGSPSETSTTNIGSKSFMDMFMDLSKESVSVPSPIFEPVKKSKQEIIKSVPKIKDKPQAKEKPIEIKKHDKKGKTKGSKKQFDDFENFFSALAEDGSDANDSDHAAGNMSFDFIESNGVAGGGGDDDDDAESDNFSFQF